MFADGRRDVADHRYRLLGSRFDFPHGAFPLLGMADTVPDLCDGGEHSLDGVVGIALHGGHGGENFLGGLTGPLGLLAYFVGDDREAAPLFSGPGGLDGCVEGGQVGLVGDLLDHGHHRVDSGAAFIQAADDLGGLLDGRLDLADVGQDLADDGGAVSTRTFPNTSTGRNRDLI